MKMKLHPTIPTGFVCLLMVATHACLVHAEEQAFEDFVFSTHEVLLKNDVSTDEFETFVREEFAPSWPEFRKGLRILVQKSDRGEREGKYALVFLSKSLKDRDLLFPSRRTSKRYRDAIEPSSDQWRKLKSYFSKGPGQVPYQSYYAVHSNEGSHQTSTLTPLRGLGLDRFARFREGMQAIRAIGTETTDDDVERLLAQDDTNEDGKIGEDDGRIRPILSRNFKQFDKNDDGFLDAAELKQTRLRPFGAKLFLVVFDKNKDGRITKDEAIHPSLYRSFDRLDTDGDGKLTSTEMDEIRGGVMLGAGPRLRRPKASDQALDADKDNDGRVSKTEADEILLEAFDKLDTDADQYLTKAELEKNERLLSRIRAAGQMMLLHDEDLDGKLTVDEYSEVPRFMRRHEFATIDKDESGSLSLLEFAESVRSMERNGFRFGQLDQNDDGKLAKNEVENPLILQNFDAYDTDEDDFLTEFEFVALVGSKRREIALSGAKNAIELFDQNKDGMLQIDEVQGRMRASFDTTDADRNGSVSVDELANSFPSLQGFRPGAQRDAVLALFRSQDSDEDGKLTVAEAPARFWKTFSRFDANSDNVLTENELTQGFGIEEHVSNVRRAGQRLLGLQVQSMEDGLKVLRVTPTSPADKAGIREADILVSMDGKTIQGLAGLRKIVASGANEKTISVTRDGETLQVNVKFPAEAPQ